MTTQRRGVDEEGTRQAGDQAGQIRVLLRAPALEQIRQALLARACQALERRVTIGGELERAPIRRARGDQVLGEQLVPCSLERAILELRALG